MMEADSGQNWTVPTEFHPASAEFSVTTAKRCVLESGNKSISLKVLKSSDQSILFAANEDQILAHINRMVGAANKNDAQQIDESLMKQLLSSFQPTEPLIAVTLDNNTNTIGWRYNEDYFATWFQREAFALYKQCHDPQLADKPNNLWMVLADSEGIDASVISDGFEMAARPLTDARPFYETYFECRDSAKTTNEADISNDENVTREEKLNRKRLQDKIEAAEQVLGNKETVSKAMSFDYATLKSLTPEQTELLAEIFSTQSDAAWERLATMELQTPAISDSLPEESGTSADNAAAPDQTAAFYAVRKAVGDRIRKSQFRAQQMQLLMKLQAAASLLDSTGTQISLEARLSGIQLWTKHSSWSRFTADGNWEPLQDHPISSEDRILLFESI